MTTENRNPFAESGLFTKSADVWTPYKMSFEGFAGGGKTFSMCCSAVGIWLAEGGTGNVILQDTEKSAKFIIPFFKKFGLIEGRNFFITHSRDLLMWNKLLGLCEQNRGTIFLTDTVTHIYEQMMVQFEIDNKRKVKYPQDALIIKPMWKEKFSTPFVNAGNTHLLFTGRAAWEYTMQTDDETGKKSFEATGVKMRGDNELAYEPDVVVLMERSQHVDGRVMVARKATILKDRSRLIDGKEFMFFTEDESGKKYTDEELQKNVWETFAPVYQVLSSGNKHTEPETESEKKMGPLFQKGGGEAWYQQRLRAENIVKEIGGIYEQWGMGGTGGLEKCLRAVINKVVFDTRTTASLVELHPDQLTEGAKVLEYLVRYCASQSEFLEAMFKKGEYDHLNTRVAEEKEKYVAELEGSKTGAPSDDDIPDFTAPAKEEPKATKPVEEKAAEGVAADKAEADKLAEINDAITNAATAKDVDTIVNFTYVEAIARLPKYRRELVKGLAKVRKAKVTREAKEGGADA